MKNNSPLSPQDFGGLVVADLQRKSKSGRGSRHGQSTSGRTGRTRAKSVIREDVRINVDLWIYVISLLNR